MLSIIAAMSPNHAIGCRGALPWHLPDDLLHFKVLTMGHPIIMGRHTFESLPHGALPGRRNIVLSRTMDDGIHGEDGEEKEFVVCRTLDDALCLCSGDDAFIIGGAEVYRQALPVVSRLHLTLVDANPPFADAFFPHINVGEWKETARERHENFTFLQLDRRSE